MDIGGFDVFIEHTLSPLVAMEKALGAIAVYWPEMITEVVDPHDVFVYEHQAAKDSWDGSGNEDYAGMMELISEKSVLTVVHERCEVIIAEIEEAIHGV